MVPDLMYLPIMPLPNVVMFPKSLLPLYIFEHRYIKLVESILNGDRLMGVALLRQGWEKSYYECPPVHRMIGIGKITQHEKLAGGKYNIWLSGLERGRIISEVQDKPFRVVKAQRAPDQFRPSRTQALIQSRRDLATLVAALADVNPDLSPQLRRALDEQISPGELADYLAYTLCGCVYDKYCFLSETNIERRLKLAAVQARIQMRETLSCQHTVPPMPLFAPQEELTLDE